MAHRDDAFSLLAQTMDGIDDLPVDAFSGVCRSICFNDPQHCNDCLTEVGAGGISPYITLCLGTAYQLPDSLQLRLIADTNLGIDRSPVFLAARDEGTFKWADCGQPPADYVFPEAQVRAWALAIARRGAREIYSLKIDSAYEGNREFPFEPDGMKLDQSGENDVARIGVAVALWAFGDISDIDRGCVTPMMMPDDHGVSECVLTRLQQ